MTQKVTGEQSERVLQLGIRLVDELRLGESCDTLARWMAHYVAELIEKVRLATPASRGKRARDCADAILKLWAQRERFPEDKRPFRDFTAVLEVMKSLDRQHPARYWPALLENSKIRKKGKDSAMLRAALGIDQAAKALIRYCIAAEAATMRQSREWIKIANGLDGADVDVRAIRLVLKDSDSLIKDQEKEHKKKVEDLLRQLSVLESAAGALRKALQKERKAGVSKVRPMRRVKRGQ